MTVCRSRGVLSSPRGQTTVSFAFCPHQDRVGVPAADQLLRGQELTLYRGFAYPRRRDSFLAGRWAAKCALSDYSGKGWLDFEVVPGVFSQPVVLGLPNAQVSLSHTDALAVAVAFPETHPMGIDVEPLTPNLRETINDHLTPAERGFVDREPGTSDQASALVWTAKEALSKVLRTGLTAPLTLLETTGWTGTSVGFDYSFAHFPQYRGLAWTAGSWAVSLCYPSVVHLEWNLADVLPALVN